MTEQGGELKDVEPLYDQSGNLRLVTTTRVSQGQEILRFPVESTIYSTMTYSDPDIAKLHDKIESSAILAYIIMNERRNPSSKYKALLDTMTTKLRTFAVYFNSQELAMLAGSTLISTGSSP